MNENFDVTDPEASVPTEITVAALIEDLSLANQVGGWFEYRDESGVLFIDQYGAEDAGIVKTWRADITFTEVDR